jgi:tetratricopeptide (TPR) repeat protein
MSMALFLRFRFTASRLKKSPVQAYQDFSEAIRFIPNYVDAYVRRAQVLTAMGRLDDAVQDLEKVRKASVGLHSYG